MEILFTILTIIGILLFLMTVLTVISFLRSENNGKPIPQIFEYNWLFIWMIYTILVLCIYGLVWILSKIAFIISFLSIPMVTLILGIIIIFTFIWIYRTK